jgi:hypothetical protein
MERSDSLPDLDWKMRTLCIFQTEVGGGFVLTKIRHDEYPRTDPKDPRIMYLCETDLDIAVFIDTDRKIRIAQLDDLDNALLEDLWLLHVVTVDHRICMPHVFCNSKKNHIKNC